MVFGKEMINRILSKRYGISVLIIVAVSALLRFINYSNRWGLAADQARDVLVSTYALNNHLIPIIGPFSSAGQFVYGPQWFWIILSMVSVFPPAIMVPWILQTLLYIFVVFVMYLVGKEIINKNFGLLLAFLTAISTAQIGQSTNLTSPSMAGIFSVFCVYFFIRYVKYSKSFDAFFLAFLIGNTINIHFQAIGLLALVPVSFLLSKRNIKQLFVLALGLFLPFIPLLIFDLKTNFFESKNMLDYYFYGQNKVFVPNRWLTYAGIFWPKTWAEIIGGQVIFGYLIIFFASLFSLSEMVKRKMSKEFLGLIISFMAIFVMLRYYKGVIFGSYIAFLDSFILIFTSWVLYKIYKLNKAVFAIVLALLILTTSIVNVKQIVNATNQTSKEAIAWKNILENKFPDEKFAIYDFKYQYPGRGLSLVLYLNADGKIADNGRKIGLALDNSDLNSRFNVIISNKNGFEAYDINSSSSAKLLKEKWIFINPSEIYQSTEYWYWDKNK